MSYEQARKDIQDHISDNFTYLSSDKIAWDNVEYNPKPNENWIRVSIQNNISEQVSFGPTVRIRRSGIVLIQIFVLKNNTTLEVNKITDALVNVFEVKNCPGVTFFSPRVNEIGISEGWFQTNISVPFYFDDNVTREV